MTSFFDKLKKGMDIENSEQSLPEEQTPEKPVPTFVSTSISKKKSFKEKTKKIKVKEEKSDKEKFESPKEKKWLEPEGELTVDVYQTDKEIVVQSAVAGIKPEDLDISIENDMITIKGIREKFLEREEKNYFYQECYWGRFSRKIISPVEIDGSRAKATMKNGVLTIRIPKIERKKKRKVVVKE